MIKPGATSLRAATIAVAAAAAAAGGGGDARSAPPPQTFPGLCRAYSAAPFSKGAALDSPAFAALAQAAGGADNIAAFCAALGIGA